VNSEDDEDATVGAERRLNARLSFPARGDDAPV
jgi:hypothetical protein